MQARAPSRQTAKVKAQLGRPLWRCGRQVGLVTACWSNHAFSQSGAPSLALVPWTVHMRCYNILQGPTVAEACSEACLRAWCTAALPDTGHHASATSTCPAAQLMSASGSRATCIDAGKAAVYVLQCGHMTEAAMYASELLLPGLHAPAQSIFRMHLCRLVLPRPRQGQLMASWGMLC